MGYNENLAERIRKALAHLPGVKEKKMFGGLAFLLDDKLCVTAGPGRMMFRIDPALHDEAIKKKGCHPVFMRGREYKGYVHVNEEGLGNQEDFNYWMGLATRFNKFAKSSKK